MAITSSITSQRMQRCHAWLANVSLSSSRNPFKNLNSCITSLQPSKVYGTSTASTKEHKHMFMNKRSFITIPCHNYINLSLPSGSCTGGILEKYRKEVQNPFDRVNIFCSLARATFSTSSDNSNSNNNNNNNNNKSSSDEIAESPTPEDILEIPPDDQHMSNSNEPKVQVSKEKLRQLLLELGMSISQWNVRNSNHPHLHQLSPQSDSTSATTGRRRRKQPRVNEEFDLYGGYNYNHHRRRSKNSSITNYNNLQSEKISARIRVRSVHAAHTIDIVSVLTKVFGPMSSMPSIRHMFSKTSVIVQLPSIIDNQEQPYNDVDAFFHPQAQPRFIAVFRYGSIVFFNVSPKDAGRILDKVKNYSTDPISRSFERKEHFEVAISPEMVQDAHVTSDFAAVKELNINNVAVISTIMGQTVAFDSYNDVVDELLSTFDDINSTVKKTGNFTAMQRETLFKVVAQNNSLFIDMIAKLGIKDRSDTAWNMSQYERIHEEMKHEFEIENRFEYIEFKLNLIQQNAKFFLEILHNQKSDTLEWIIIVLIAFECGLMILEMSGFGQTIFDFLFASDPSSSVPVPVPDPKDRFIK